MVERGTALRLGAAVVLLVAAAAGLYLFQLGSNFQQPELRAMESEFGAVTDEQTAVRSHLVVYNPNDESLPGAAEVTYTIRMNDVTMARGAKAGVGLDPGRNELDLTADLDNAKIPAWWVTHVNNGEQTRLSIVPGVSVTGVPIGSDLPARNRTIVTDLLSTFSRDEPRTVTLNDRPLMTVSNQTARWGEADRERTPIVVTSHIENTHDEPVRLDGTEYRIEMNGVVVGNGTTDEGFVLDPGASTTYTVRPAIDTPRMQAWWASHVQNDERTRLSVEVYGVVEQDGERTRVPISVFEREARVHSDFLGDGNTTVDPVDRQEESFTFEAPVLVGSDSEWGDVGDETTEIDTRLTVENPNDGEVGDLVRLDVSQETRINEVPVADGATRVGPLAPGTNEASLTSAFKHSAVPAWWARHLNAGEQSAVVTVTDTTADVGVTTIDVEATDDRSQTLETDLLAGFNDTSDRAVEQDGQRVATIRETRAAWGRATEQTAPIDTAVTVRNERTQPITITDITYTVRLNSVVLADNRTVQERYEIAPFTTETIRPTFLLDNAKMAAWWPTHVDNGESSTLHTEVYLTVESPLGEKRVKVDAFSNDRTVTTEFV